MKIKAEQPIILFDGVCNLCDSSVQFIIKRDSKQKYVFSSLQSDAAKQILLQHNYKKNTLNSILLIENEKIYDQSTAALKISKNLDGYPKYVYYLIYLPKGIRDFVYQVVAKNRYKWFGKKDSCMIPTGELKNRFI